MADRKFQYENACNEKYCLHEIENCCMSTFYELHYFSRQAVIGLVIFSAFQVRLPKSKILY